MAVNQITPKRDKGYEMVQLEFEKRKEVSLSPLLQAAKDGDLKALTQCLDAGGNLFEIEKSEKSCILHLAAENDDFEKGISCCLEILSRVELNHSLEGLGNLISHQDFLQQTPIFSAVGKGNAKLVEILLHRGAQPTINTFNGTLFHVLSTLESHSDAINCAEILLDTKYFENDVDKLHKYLRVEEVSSNRSALHRTAINGNHALLQLLISNGADPTQTDFFSCNVFHHAVGNAFEVNAFNCTEILIQNHLIDGWDKVKDNLLRSFDKSGACPIHIAARRGFHRILSIMSPYYLIPEANTGLTALHSAASLGNRNHAEICVRQLLESVDPREMREFLNLQDQEGCTALYLGAKHQNVEACKLLLVQGSAFDIKTKRGKTPLQEVYAKVPQVVSVLLDQAIQNSGYVATIGAVNTRVELDFGPILGYSTSRSNLYKETEELAKVCYAKFDDRQVVLNHIFIRVFVHFKWEKVKAFFIFFRLLHILWFLYNCFFLISLYRVECPYANANAREYSWTRLRPPEDEHLNITKNLPECKISGTLRGSGIVNIFLVFLYLLSQLHYSKQKFHWLFLPTKAFKPNTSIWRKIWKRTSYYTCLWLQILPCWPIVIGTGIVITTLPSLGVIPFPEVYHYILAGVMGLLIWLAIYLELGKFPKFRVYVNLLMRSTRTLLFAIAVTAPILFGFANVFVILIPGEPSFSSAAQSFVKVITFMIGELDYQGLFYGEKETVFLGIVMLALAVFIVIIVVLLVNFLIGLAAEEIRDFWERARIWEMCTKLEQIMALESFLDESLTVFGRDFLRKHLMLMPPERKMGKLTGRQKRKALILIPTLPKDMQKELHELNLKTLREMKY